ncbi:MAG: recombination mediator RecR [Alphaproteobacteria bacterium]|jgi:recombination protein RecR|nr:recombination protein RecR [Rhodospirillaceae bacterium]MDP6021262.1 recombination mediator RecR [Alphaproteobacteria bacterium]MDP6257199.1 recombination mediator RecR [Alphaproteobacteria bacterium]MDP7054033.1 recombination mediator RecR [Alphaproteobacteria bacterium]MDP7227344.1 recombination mediator RecR [Alphaproteobacteria bacterium]|tara:strand:+ start:3803 stop:4396 length:594 start_codon:yes stop_codon:yes gene_type:complete
MTGTQIDQLIQLLAKLPGLGPRSARRAALHLIDRKESLLRPLAQAMGQAADSVAPCDVCGNLDSVQPCAICRDQRRDGCQICVVESVADLWALERSGVFRGRYHVLGGTLSALDGIGPEDLNVGALIARAGEDAVGEVILATNATVDGQTTAHFLAEKLSDCNVKVSGLAHGVPVGGELDYLDDGTLATALGSRRPV